MSSPRDQLPEHYREMKMKINTIFIAAPLPAPVVAAPPAPRDRAFHLTTHTWNENDSENRFQYGYVHIGWEGTCWGHG